MDENCNCNDTIKDNNEYIQSIEMIDNKIKIIKEELTKIINNKKGSKTKEEKIENEIKEINLKQQYDSLCTAKKIKEMEEQKNTEKYNEIKEKYEKVQEQKYIETEIKKCKKIIELHFENKQYDQVIEWTKKLEIYENEYESIPKIETEEINLKQERLSLIKNENKIVGFFKKVINVLKGSFERL